MMIRNVARFGVRRQDARYKQPFNSFLSHLADTNLFFVDEFVKKINEREKKHIVNKPFQMIVFDNEKSSFAFLIHITAC